MNQIQTSIAAVNARTTNTGRQLWDVVDASGVKYTAWEPAQAQQAMALVGQPVLLVYTEKQDGQYINRSFKSAMPSAVQNFGSFAPVQQQPVAVNGLGTTTNGTATITYAAPQATPPSDRDAQIVRQSAYKAAVELIAQYVSGGSYNTLAEAMLDLRSVTEELVAFGLTGKWGGSAAWGGAATPAAAAPTDGSVNDTSAPWD